MEKALDYNGLVTPSSTPYTCPKRGKVLLQYTNNTSKIKMQINGNTVTDGLNFCGFFPVEQGDVIYSSSGSVQWVFYPYKD